MKSFSLEEVLSRPKIHSRVQCRRMYSLATTGQLVIPFGLWSKGHYCCKIWVGKNTVGNVIVNREVLYRSELIPVDSQPWQVDWKT